LFSTKLGESGQEKVLEEFVEESSVFGFEILPQPSERLCIHEPGWRIAYLPGRVYVIGYVWSAAELQAKNVQWQLVCANVFGLEWSP
jgi:hypothetical protein